MVWGIDIGKSALKAVKLRSTKDGLEIQAVEHVPYPVEDDEDERQEHVNDAVRNFLVKHKIGADDVVVGLPGLHAFSRFIKLGPVDKAKVGTMVRMEAQQQIPFPIAEVNWDWVRVGSDEDDVEVGIFATRSELIQGFLGDLREHKIEPSVVTIAPLAVYNFVRYNSGAFGAATIILDMGSEHTDLVIADGDRFWIRNLRIAGNDITKALAERFKVPFAEAEKLKRSASKSQQSKKIFSAMEPVLKDLVGEIHRSVGFFKSQAGELDVKNMVLMGDAAKLKNMTKFFSGELGYECERVQRLEQDKFLIDGEVDLDLLKNHLLGFGVALGLAIQGAGRSQCAINLAPPELQVQSQLKKKLPLAAAAAVCSWAALGLSWAYWGRAHSQILETVAAAEGVSKYDKVQKEAEEVRDVSALQTEAEGLAGLGGGRTLVLDLLERLAPLLPKENGRLPKLDAQFRQAELNRQLLGYADKLQRENIHDGKLWILDLRIRRVPPVPAAQGVAPRPGELFKVEMLVAKALPATNRNAGQVRDRIKSEFVNGVMRDLAGEPFWIRDAEVGQGQEPQYGSVFVGPPEEIYGLHPTIKTDDGRSSFFCVMVPVKFEVGVPPPPPAPPPGEQPQEEGE